MTAMERFIFFDEAAQAGVPLPLMALDTVGPTIMRYGTDEQKAYFLPRILSGEIDFAIGYSEPGAGTDLASLKTRAVRDGDGRVVVAGPPAKVARARRSATAPYLAARLARS